MTFELLERMIRENQIPATVTLMSDSGWECSATQMNGVFYNAEENILMFTQESYGGGKYEKDECWKLLTTCKGER